MCPVWYIFTYLLCHERKECKMQKNWCTVTVTPTIEHQGRHSWTPAKPEVRPGAREESASPGWLATPAMNARDTTKVYIYGGLTLDLDRHYIGSVTPARHQTKRHNNTSVEYNIITLSWFGYHFYLIHESHVTLFNIIIICFISKNNKRMSCMMLKV